MFYVKMQDGKAVAASNEYPGNEAISQRGAFENRNDWPTMERAEQIARELNEAAMQTVAQPFIAIDNGPNVSPRYDVIERPMVGDPVSYSFNGDTYPDGTITKIAGAGFRIVTTDTGSRYYRRGTSGRWVKQGGTWGMVKGHVSTYNREF
jgi:hypothetical protein